MVPLVKPFVPMVMPMVQLALPMVQLVPLVSQWHHWLPMIPLEKLVKLPMVPLGEPRTEPLLVYKYFGRYDSGPKRLTYQALDQLANLYSVILR